MAPQTNSLALEPRLPDSVTAEATAENGLSSAAQLRVVIVDDNQHFSNAAARLLEGAGITVVGSASNTAEALELVGELLPDVTLVDIDLGEESGFGLVEQLHGTGRAGRTATILTSAHAEQDFADMIAASPAIGFLSKADLSPSAIRDLLAA